MEKQQITFEQKQQCKEIFLLNIHQPQRLTFEKLWNRLEVKRDFFKVLSIMQNISQSQGTAEIMLQMSQEDFIANFPSDYPTLNVPPNLHNANQKKIMLSERMCAEPINIMKQSQSLMIAQNFEEYKENQKNIDITVYSKFLIQNNIQKNAQFNRKFRQEDFEQFFHFYFEYQQSELLTESKIYKQVKQEIGKRDLTLDGLKRQILITDSALYYSSPKYRLRPTQILAIYCFLSKIQINKNLLQILTGEGKSTTIACLSAILVMRGHSVDIITTSPILVKRDVEQKTDFYNLLGMKMDHNLNEDSKACLSPKECYAGQNIVIGTPFSFQVDLLYDEYQQKGTRNKRPYDVVIIDEVDSMLIDEKQNQTLLASQFAGFSELLLPMRIIWQTILSKDIIKEDDKIYLYQNGQKKGEIIKGEANQVMKVIVEDLRKKFKNQFIPAWRLQFIDHSLDDWIQSAITAAHIYRQNHHYIVQKGKIVPVNFKNNGCLQRNVHWQNGLHQFLQMKHGLHVQSQTMTSNFMSNIGHFMRYKNLYGLTGTLGSAESKRFLQFTYGVEMLQIPPFIQRRLKIQPGFLMFAELQWIDKIVERTKNIIDSERGALIICQTIQDTDIVSYALTQRKVNYKNIRIMKTGQQKHQDTITCRQIIIATNVAGRGTDLKAKDELIKKGGLHVIITFMPQNYRIEMQARGRAGRNGAPGSSQVIANYEKYCEQIGAETYQKAFFDALGWEHDIKTFCQNYRDKIEAQLMKNDKQTVKKLKTKDNMFKFFCDAVKKIPDYMQNNAKKHAIQEAWGMFLKKVQIFKWSDEQMLQQAEKLANQFVTNSEGYYNPSHGVWRGIHSYNKNNLDDAKKHFKDLQSQNSTKNNNIAGNLLQAAVRINQDDRTKKSDYNNCLKLLQTAMIKCEEKKQLEKANHSLRLTIDNQHSLSFLENQSQRELQQSINLISSNGSQAMKLEQNFIPNQKVNEIQKRQMTRLMNSPSINLLTSIQDHIKTQMDRISNVKPDEYVEMSLKNLKDIINLQQNDENNQQLKQVYESLVPDLPCLPEAQIKKIPKKKNNIWKRFFVFCLGVFQVCVGSLIVAASCGAAASFGAHMIYQGLVDCAVAIFKPELCEDLKAYFTEKVLSYSISLATIGMSGIKQLASIGKQGFSIIKNSTMKEIFKKTAQNISIGFAKGIVNKQGAIKKLIFQGVSSKLVTKNQMKAEDILRAVQQPEFKKKIQKASKQEQKLEFDGQKIQQKFESEFEKIIKKTIEDNFPNFIKQLKNLNLKTEHVAALITIVFQQTIQQNFHKSQTQENKQMQKKMYHFVSKNLHNDKLAQKVISQFKIEKLIINSMKNISQNTSYEKLVQHSKILIFNQIVTTCNQIIEKQKSKLSAELSTLTTQQNVLNTSAMTPDQHNTRVNQFNANVKIYQEKQKNLNQFVQQFKKLPQKQKMIDLFITKGIIQNGNINKNSINSNAEFHQFLKQALLKLENFETSQSDFKEDLMNKAYNTFATMVLNTVNQIIDNSSNSISRLKEIENKLYKDLYQKK